MFANLILLFGGGGDLVDANDSEHGHLADATAITTTTNVVVSNAIHGQLTDQALIVTVILAPADATHSQLTDAASVVKVVSPADGTHSQIADASSLASVNTVSPRECTHSTTVDQAVVLAGIGQPGDVVLELDAPITILELVTYDTQMTVEAAITYMEVYE